MSSIEFLLGVLDTPPARIAWEDLQGSHGNALRLLQEQGFLDREPGKNPVLSCPHCGEGVPYMLGERILCNRCHSTVDRRHLLLWRIDVKAFLGWLARELGLRGDVRQIDDCLWQLGTSETQGLICEYFYRCRGTLSDAGKRRLAAYRSAVTLYGLSCPSDRDATSSSSISLLEILQFGETLAVLNRTPLLPTRGNVRFDAESGVLWAGEVVLGEVPVGSKEYSFLDVLARNLDRFVSYEELKSSVLLASGSRDTTEEATFCHNLKSRIKKKWIPTIDRLLATTNKGNGYRLRGHVKP